MAENVLTWNTANWITVVLMVAIGFAVLGFVARMVQTSGGKSAPTGPGGNS